MGGAPRRGWNALEGLWGPCPGEQHSCYLVLLAASTKMPGEHELLTY